MGIGAQLPVCVEARGAASCLWCDGFKDGSNMCERPWSPSPHAINPTLSFRAPTITTASCPVPMNAGSPPVCTAKAGMSIEITGTDFPMNEAVVAQYDAWHARTGNGLHVGLGNNRASFPCRKVIIRSPTALSCIVGPGVGVGYQLQVEAPPRLVIHMCSPAEQRYVAGGRTEHRVHRLRLQLPGTGAHGAAPCSGALLRLSGTEHLRDWIRAHLPEYHCELPTTATGVRCGQLQHSVGGVQRYYFGVLDSSFRDGAGG